MRMKYLEQCWYGTVWGTKCVRPDFITINQVSSSYALSDTTDGVDSRQARPYDVVCGHGGYSDQPFGKFTPVRSCEAMWGWTWDKPHYYLPMWYTHDWASMRNEVWMSLSTKLDGLLYTPEQDFGMNNDKAPGFNGSNTILEIAEINRRIALIGDVMRQLRKSLSPVAVLHSHRQMAWDIATVNADGPAAGAPFYASPHREAVDQCFFRTMETGIVPNYIDEGEVEVKGASFLKQWKVIYCPKLAYAAPAFRKALEGYIAGGGKLVQCKDDKLKLAGATVVDHSFVDMTAYYNQNKDNRAAYVDLVLRQRVGALAPNFAKELAGWLGDQPYSLGNKQMVLGVHKAGPAAYLFIANNVQSKDNPRQIKWELVPAETNVKVPAGGVLYDLLNGGEIPFKVMDAATKAVEANLKLAAGDGAVLVHLPKEPGKMKLSVDADDQALNIDLAWGTVGILPFRLRIIDPQGNVLDDLYRATSPATGGSTRFIMGYPLGANAAPGTWTVEVSEWLTGTTVKDTVKVGAAKSAALIADDDPVSIYLDDAKKIAGLLAGRPFQPDYSKLNWDAKRVFGIDPKKFAVFGDTAPAEKIASALRAKGMAVEVNPAYEIKDFVKEPNRGGAGPTFRLANFENIYAHTIVLPGHKLAQQSFNRGHINRPVTATFPGPGRAYIQWGIGCYQACWQNVFVFGDGDAGVQWLLDTINGKVPAAAVADLKASVKPAGAKPQPLPGKITVAQEIGLHDAPAGVASSPDGKTTYAAMYDGTVCAFNAAGKELWRAQPLMDARALALNPKGDRLAVGGYPGMAVLNAADGTVLGAFKEATTQMQDGENTFTVSSLVVSLAWNDAGAIVAGGATTGHAKSPLASVILLDAQGKQLPSPAVPGNVMGVAFAPKSVDVLLVGGDKLTAVKIPDGQVLWSNDIRGAQAFAFSADGKTAAAGGWGKNAGTFSLADGKIIKMTPFQSVVGGVAFTPDGNLAVAVWGRTWPLYSFAAEKPEPLFQSKFGFQSVSWSDKLGGLVAAEQGGTIWLLGADGKPKACLDGAGTTAYRMAVTDRDLVVGRMNRVVQRLAVK